MICSYDSRTVTVDVKQQKRWFKDLPAIAAAALTKYGEGRKSVFDTITGHRGGCFDLVAQPPLWMGWCATVHENIHMDMNMILDTR